MLYHASCPKCSFSLRYAVRADGAFRFLRFYARDGRGARRFRPVEGCPGCGAALLGPAQLASGDVAKQAP